MRISQSFPSKYLRAADLSGRAYVVTIRGCHKEDVSAQEQAAEEKPVVYFQGADKGLVLNKTNALVLETLHGDETDAWPGKQVEMFPSTVLFNNAMVPCIRLRPPVKAAGAAFSGETPQDGTVIPAPAQPVIGGAQHTEVNPPLHDGTGLDDEIPF